jgi:hypothetical protein
MVDILYGLNLKWGRELFRAFRKVGIE